MHIHPDVASVVGQTSEVAWGQVLVLPQAYGVVQVEEPGGRALQYGVSVLTKVTHELQKTPASLADVEGIADAAILAGVLTLILLVPRDKTLYVVVRGNGAVYLKRGQQLACLLKQSGSVSGDVQIGDTILLVNDAFAHAIPEAEFGRVIDHLPPKEIAERLTLMAHAAEHAMGSAALVFSIEAFLNDKPESELSLAETVQAEEAIHHEQKAFLPRRHIRIPGIQKIKRTWQHPGGRKKILLIAVTIVLILFFLFSVGMGIKKQLSDTSGQKMVAATTEAQHAYDEGMALMELNRMRSRERLQEAKQLLAPFKNETAKKTKEGRHLLELAENIEQNLSLAMRIYKGEPQPFFDAALVKKGAVISSFALAGDQLALLDATGKSVFALSIAAKNGRVIAGGDGFESALAIAATPETVYITTRNGIHAVRLSDMKVKKNIVPKQDMWGSINSMVAYGGNLYLSDTQKSRIWKYIADEAGVFGTMHEYLNPDTLPDFSQTTGMSIDGSVWFGTSVGKILRFTQGKENPILPQGIEPALGPLLRLYTDDEATNIYILDANQKRIVVLDKDAVYISQYIWTGDVQPDQFIVSEAQKKIFLLAKGQILSLDIQ